MEYTQNLKLSKPSYDDDVDVQVLNNNMDILDSNITEKIKAILGTANWQNTPEITLFRTNRLLGEGAIVASKLDQSNGFVRFANGFIIQWGLFWFTDYNTYVDVTLPIACTVLVCLATDDISSVSTKSDNFFINWNSGYSKNNRTSVRFLCNAGPTGNFSWMCIGKV